MRDDERSSRLFWFFKNVGRTSKTGEQLGSVGIGKTVFPDSSRINTFFGYSVRELAAGESPIVLLGQWSLSDGLGMPWSSRLPQLSTGRNAKTEWHQLNAEPHYVVRNINAGTDTQKAQKRGDS